MTAASPIWFRFSETTTLRRMAPKTRRQRLRQMLRQVAADDRRRAVPITLALLRLPPVPSDG